MRRNVLMALAAAAVAGCGSDRQGDVSCAQLERDEERRAAMTRAVQDATGVDATRARAHWETYCSNSTDPEVDKPFTESVQALRETR